MEVVPDESLMYHAQRNHFSNWLAMRGYLEIANRIKAYNDLDNIGNLRDLLKALLKRQRKMRQKNSIVDYFQLETYDPEVNLVRIGGGSLGGKARGIIFISIFLRRFDLGNRFPDIDINVPDAAMIGTDIFDGFMERNKIRISFDQGLSDEEVDEIFLKGDFDPAFVRDLRAYLSYHQRPVAVRSSSLLEDSAFQPFAGIYNTFMVPCCALDPVERLNIVLQAIKRVYASCYHQKALVYLMTTGNRIEDEKMAVLIQDIVGEAHDGYFYPVFSGNLQTYNFYPLDKIQREDGIANVALGLGKTVVSGMKTLRFSPKHPSVLTQFYDRKSILRNSQSHFYALKTALENVKLTGSEEDNMALLPLDIAEKHGTLGPVASVYETESEMFRESLFEDGPRIVTFANILKWKIFPLDQILIDLMNFGRSSLGCEVELEFAGNVSLDREKKPSFSILQIRPLITHSEMPLLNKESIDNNDILCSSNACLGNGLKTNICDLIFVKLDGFNTSNTRAIAREIGKLNKEFDKKSPYLLVGPGRWGSSDFLLGIPVDWNDISNVGAIIEVGLPSFHVDPSFGSHFFQNLVSLGIEYFFTSPKNYKKSLDLDWLNNQKPFCETRFLKHLRFSNAMTIQTDGKEGTGFILKPGLFERYMEKEQEQLL